MSCQNHVDPRANPRDVTRRWFLEQCGVGLGGIALGHLLASTGRAEPAATNPLAPRSPHFAPKAKNVIFLFMAGAPSHLELFDYKPQLAKFNGTLPPPELLSGYRAAFINPNSKLLGPKFQFARHGACGAEISELLPHLAGVVDEVAIVKSMVTDAFNHAPGQILMSTGSQQFGRPSIGAWALTGWEANRRICPVSSCSAQERKVPAAETRIGAAVSCRRSIKACSFAPAAIRCSIFRTRRASTRRWPATRSRRSGDSISCASTASATRRSPRVFIPLR